MHGAQDSSSFILLHEHSKVFKIIYTNCPGNVCPGNVRYPILRRPCCNRQNQHRIQCTPQMPEKLLFGGAANFFPQQLDTGKIRSTKIVSIIRCAATERNASMFVLCKFLDADDWIWWNATLILTANHSLASRRSCLTSAERQERNCYLRYSRIFTYEGMIHQQTTEQEGRHFNRRPDVTWKQRVFL